MQRSGIAILAGLCTDSKLKGGLSEGNLGALAWQGYAQLSLEKKDSALKEN